MTDILELARKCGGVGGTEIVIGRSALCAFRDAVLEEAAVKCDEQAAEWDSDAVVTEKNYAAASAAAIRAMKDKP